MKGGIEGEIEGEMKGEMNFHKPHKYWASGTLKGEMRDFSNNPSLFFNNLPLSCNKERFR